MEALHRDNFGLLIAYVIPGFIVLWGIGLHSEIVAGWLGKSTDAAPTIGGFLYVTLASVAVGLLVSTLRWAVVDTIHHRTGIPEPTWDFSRLQTNLAGFVGTVENHYRFYQFHANAFLALLLVFVAYAADEADRSPSFGAATLAFVLIEAILWYGSRDTLRKYYDRGGALLNLPSRNENGGRHRKPAIRLEGLFR
ncbi:MAG: hypothetical protein WD069_21590 [Planctomycetales bacterium]